MCKCHHEVDIMYLSIVDIFFIFYIYIKSSCFGLVLSNKTRVILELLAEKLVIRHWTFPERIFTKGTMLYWFWICIFIKKNIYIYSSGSKNKIHLLDWIRDYGMICRDKFFVIYSIMSFQMLNSTKYFRVKKFFVGVRQYIKTWSIKKQHSPNLIRKPAGYSVKLRIYPYTKTTERTSNKNDCYHVHHNYVLSTAVPNLWHKYKLSKPIKGKTRSNY